MNITGLQSPWQQMIGLAQGAAAHAPAATGPAASGPASPTHRVAPDLYTRTSGEPTDPERTAPVPGTGYGPSLESAPLQAAPRFEAYG